MIKLLQAQGTQNTNMTLLAGTFQLLGIEDEMVLDKWERLSGMLVLNVLEIGAQLGLILRQYPLTVAFA